ncbi:hypothetical protein H0H92_001315 [Tricholoma furcatifolium]|nr:hypothetical protein H0H92_001315 [Tricholoma furcatifolium]
MVHHHQPYYGHGPQFYCPQPPPFPHQPILSPISPQLPAYYDHRTIQASDAAPIAPWSAPLVNFRPDQSGWYSQVPPSPNVPVINRSAPFSPPGLTRQDSPPQPQPPAPVMSEPPPSEIIIHDFWKGRFAPFPGFSSRPGHLSARQPSRIKITAPTTKKPTKSPLQLLPPKSFMNLPTISPESNSSESEISTTDTQDALLGWELDNSALEKEKIVLWKVGIKIAIWVDAEFVLAVPGIRENYPRLEIGDLFHLREVIERLQRGSGVAFEGRVTALRKREGLVREYILATLNYTALTPED